MKIPEMKEHVLIFLERAISDQKGVMKSRIMRCKDVGCDLFAAKIFKTPRDGS